MTKLWFNLKCLTLLASVGITLLTSCKKNEIPYEDCAGIIACEYHLENGRTFQCIIDQTKNTIENTADSILFSVDNALLSKIKLVFTTTDHAKIHLGDTEIKSGDILDLTQIKEFVLTARYNQVTKAYQVKAHIEKKDHSETVGALINPNMRMTGLPDFNYFSSAKFNGMLYILGARYPEGISTKTAYYELYKSIDGWNWEKVTTTPEVIAGFGTELVVANNTLFAVGGLKLWGKDILGNPAESSPVWRIFSTTDGTNWKDCTQGQVNAPTSRGFAEVTAHNGYLIVRRGFYVGFGSFQGRTESLLYRSTNGTNWEKVTTTQTTAHSRTAGLLFSFNNKLYMGGGYSNWFSTTGGKGDMWESSDNGTTWEKVADNVELLKRFGGKAITHNGKIYILGGVAYDAAGVNQVAVNTIIESTDGKTWTPLKAEYQLPGGFPQRIYPSVFTDNGAKFWIIGGLNEAKGNYGINSLDAQPRFDAWTKTIK